MSRHDPVRSNFRPPWYLRSGHLQTILGPYALKRTLLQTTVRHEVPLHQNNGATYLYDSAPPSGSSDASTSSSESKVVLLIHGLGGDHSSPYLTRIASRLVEKGHRAMRIDLPGCGPSAILSDRAAHAGCTEDLRAILQWIASEFGVTKLQLAGFSLGGNIVLKLLAESASADRSGAESWRGPKVERAVVVAPPVDLAHCCRLIESGFNNVYNKFFLKILKRVTRQRAKLWPAWKRLVENNQKPIRSIREFDDAYTSQIAGFRDAADYYAQCATIHRLVDIRTPTSILMDFHDPIVPASLLENVPLADCIDVTTSRLGGHIGYFHRPPGSKLACWMDDWVLEKLVGHGSSISEAARWPAAR